MVTRRVKSDAEMVVIIRGEIRVGTSIDNAQRFMEREGFTCQREIGRKGWILVSCKRSDKDGPTIVRDWRVDLNCRDGKLVDVAASGGPVER
jgi:hypothetical protein